MKFAGVLFAAITFCLSGNVRAASPNVLFIIADDASRSFGEAYGCSWANTPNIDQLARTGLVFENAYTPTSKCAPSRASILTGRYPWLLEAAANHQPYFPAKFIAFSEALQAAGVACGGTGKTWGPGEAKNADGSQRDFALGGGKMPGSPSVRFADFLEKRPADKPFFYWFGSSNPHRPYKLDSGIMAGKKPADVTHVPAHWPDNDVVRRDMLDYAIEIEAYDAEVGSLLETLKASGAANNTLVIVTSDHGMPFPRVKGHTNDDANHIPLVACWPDGIVNPGRRVVDFVSFIDLAPTFLELQQVNGGDQGMSPIIGRSFTDILRGQGKTNRDFIISGRERNDVDARPGSLAGLGYPVRSIRVGTMLYIHNFEPDRWPCGDIDLGLTDTDSSPTKQLIETLGDQSPFWQQAFGKRPAEQLFDIAKDPDCMKNLAVDPEFKIELASLREKLMSELKSQGDPRVLGQGAMFDEYPSPRSKLALDAAKNQGTENASQPKKKAKSKQ